jgi:hypothetical protein
MAHSSKHVDILVLHGNNSYEYYIVIRANFKGTYGAS